MIGHEGTTSSCTRGDPDWAWGRVCHRKGGQALKQATQGVLSPHPRYGRDLSVVLGDMVK